MADFGRSGGTTRAKGITHPLSKILGEISSALSTRLELFVTELEEERERLKQSLLLILVLFFGLSLGIILITIFLVAIFWQAGWIYALGILATVYLGIGITAGLLLRKAVVTRPRLFSASLGELGKDRDRLRTTSRE
jgi:uncharacterized membrane protein YqjE